MSSSRYIFTNFHNFRRRGTPLRRPSSNVVVLRIFSRGYIECTPFTFHPSWEVSTNRKIALQTPSIRLPDYPIRRVNADFNDRSFTLDVRAIRGVKGSRSTPYGNIESYQTQWRKPDVKSPTRITRSYPKTTENVR